jgi:hypothetical protein
MLAVGGNPVKTKQVIILLQTIPSALVAAIYWMIAHRLASRMTPTPRLLAPVVAVVSCLWPESLLRLTTVWYYVWQELGVALLVWCAMRWYDSLNLREGLIMGAVTGFVALINPTPVPIFAVALVVPFLKHRGHHSTIVFNMIASAATALLLVSPWLVRNALVFERFIPMRSNFGVELLQGNNPVGSVRQSVNSVHPWTHKEELKQYRELGEVEYTRRALKRAVQYIRQHPRVTAIRVAQRVYVTWCTDLFDQWPWIPGHKWWRRGRRAMIFSLTTIASALIPLSIVLTGLFTGRLRCLPYRSLFISVFLFLPLLQYICIASERYSQGIRPWLAILAVIVLFGSRKSSYLQGRLEY